MDSLLEKEVLKKRGGCVPLIASYNPVFKYLCENGKAKKELRIYSMFFSIFAGREGIPTWIAVIANMDSLTLSYFLT